MKPSDQLEHFTSNCLSSSDQRDICDTFLSKCKQHTMFMSLGDVGGLKEGRVG